MRPLVIAYHLIWTVYGWWLPNDPRGSGSHRTADHRIASLGELHFGRKKLQPTSCVIREFYTKATAVLKYPLVEIRDAEIGLISAAFADVIKRERYTCYACAIMPDHVHILIRKHKHRAEEMIENLQIESRVRLIDSRLRSNDHPVWTGGTGWKVFLDHPDDIERTISYIEDNPIKIGRAAQHWEFVIPYDRWPLHEGHNPNSPYVKRLRAVGRYP